MRGNEGTREKRVNEEGRSMPLCVWVGWMFVFVLLEIEAG